MPADPIDQLNLPQTPLAFTDNLKFDVPAIDRQHQRMVQIVNHLLMAVTEGALGEAEDHLLDELVRLATRNFRTEEDWMRRCNYENGTLHAESHAHLLQELVSLRDGLFTRHEHMNRKAVFFIRRWLEQHLLHSDRELAEAIRKHMKARGRARQR